MNTRWTAQQALVPTADPAWVLDQHGFDPLRDSSREARFAVSNGFLGVRGGRTIDRLPNPNVPPRTWVAGLFDVLASDQTITALVPAPDWLKIDVSMAGHEGSPAVADLSFHRRVLDFRRGALITHSRTTSHPGLTVRLCVLRLVSLHTRALGLQVIEINVDAGEAEVTLEASFEELEFGLVSEVLEQERGAWRTNAGKHLAMVQAAVLRIDGQAVPGTPLSPFRRAWTWQARPGQVVRFERIVAIATGVSTPETVMTDAQQHLAAASALGWPGVLAQHEASWAQRWRDSDVVVGGDPAAQHALRFALYHLNGAANPEDAHVSIAARALTGADYHGHVFWETEIFLLPFYTLTWPEAARALLTYRFNTLDGARAKARLLGWRGAMYAWESADTGRKPARTTAWPRTAGSCPSCAGRRSCISARTSPTPSGTTGRQPGTTHSCTTQGRRSCSKRPASGPAARSGRRTAGITYAA